MQFTLKKVLSYKEECLFCNNKLNIVLSNFIGFKNNGKPILFSKLDKHIFRFTLHDGMNKFKCSLHCNTNVLSFEINEQVDDLVPVKNFFEKLCPHLELYCSNKKCASKYDYYLSTDIFKFTETKRKNKFKLLPFHFYMEGFTLNNFWIQNDWIRKDLNIYKKNDPDADPIQLHALKFNGLNEEKIIKKIMTLISFS